MLYKYSNTIQYNRVQLEIFNKHRRWSCVRGGWLPNQCFYTKDFFLEGVSSWQTSTLRARSTQKYSGHSQDTRIKSTTILTAAGNTDTHSSRDVNMKSDSPVRLICRNDRKGHELWWLSETIGLETQIKNEMFWSNPQRPKVLQPAVCGNLHFVI